MSAFVTKIARLKFRQKSRSKSDGESSSGVASSASFEKKSLLESISERASVHFSDLQSDDVLLAFRRQLDSEQHLPQIQAEKTTYLYPQDIDSDSLSDDSSCSSSDEDDDDVTDGGNFLIRPRHHISPGEEREDGRVHRIIRAIPLRIRDMHSFSAVDCAELQNKQPDAVPKHLAPDAILIEDDNTIVHPFSETQDRPKTRTKATTKSHDIHSIDFVFRRMSTVSEDDLGFNRQSFRRTPSISDLTEEGFGIHRRSSSESSDENDDGIIPHLLSFDDGKMGPCHDNCGFSRSVSFS